MELSKLPSEILGLILDSASVSFALLRLWKCGNRILNAKLSSGITYVDWRHSSLLPSQVPSLLFDLPNLRNVTLKLGDYHHVDQCSWKSTITRLPRGLQTLRIGRPQHGSSFDEAFLLPQAIPDPDITPSIASNEQVCPLEMLFPELTTLYINRMDSSVVLTLTTFPSTLTRLRIPDVEFAPRATTTPLLMSVLPRSLIHFDTRIQVFFGFRTTDQTRSQAFLKDWTDAPPLLEHIREIAFWRSPPRDLNWMPRTLTKCQLKGINQSDASIQSLPPALISVHFNGFISTLGSLDWVQVIPRSLTTLALERQAWFYDLQSVIDLLPRSLTHLSVPNARLNSLYPRQRRRRLQLKGALAIERASWPPNLIHLACSIESLPLGLLALLPRTIAVLKLTYNSQRSKVCLKLVAAEIAPHLESFSLSTIRAHRFFSLQIDGALPSSLTEVIVTPQTINSSGPTRDSIEQLPKSVTSLTMRSSSGSTAPSDNRYFGSWKRPLQLPPRLTNLDIEEMSFSWFAALPRSLTRLSIRALRIPLVTQGVDEMDVFRGLPPNLTELRVERSNGCHPGHHRKNPPTLSPLSFQHTHLPLLRKLVIERHGTFPSAALRNLPKSLTCLIIFVEDPQENDISCLSNKLIDIEINDEIIAHGLLEMKKYSVLKNRRHLLYH